MAVWNVMMLASMAIWLGIAILLIILGRTMMLDGFTVLVLEIGAVVIGIILSLYFMCEADTAVNAFLKIGLIQCSNI